MAKTEKKTNETQQKAESPQARLHEDRASRARFAGARWTSLTVPVAVGRRRIIAKPWAAQSIPTKKSHLHRGAYLQTATTKKNAIHNHRYRRSYHCLRFIHGSPRRRSSFSYFSFSFHRSPTAVSVCFSVIIILFSHHRRRHGYH